MTIWLLWADESWKAMSSVLDVDLVFWWFLVLSIWQSVICGMPGLEDEPTLVVMLAGQGLSGELWPAQGLQNAS